VHVYLEDLPMTNSSVRFRTKTAKMYVFCTIRGGEVREDNIINKLSVHFTADKIANCRKYFKFKSAKKK